MKYIMVFPKTMANESGIAGWGAHGRIIVAAVAELPMTEMQQNLGRTRMVHLKAEKQQVLEGPGGSPSALAARR